MINEGMPGSAGAAAEAAGESDWPLDLRAATDRAVTVEYASLTAAGAPITVPVTPYLGRDGSTIDVSTGVTYPVKAERARRNVKVALLFADSLGAGDRRTVISVQGLASVRDADLQANTDRYIRLSMAKLPEAYAAQPKWLTRRMAWYLARVWIEITPTRIMWWADGNMAEAPQHWVAATGIEAPPSDPAPASASPPPSDRPSPARQPDQEPADWRSEVATAASFPLHDLTVVSSDGFPLVMPVRELTPTARGFRFKLPTGVEHRRRGRACLTAHTHSVPFASQQNRAFLGELICREDGTNEVHVDRLLPDLSIPSGRVQAIISLAHMARRLRPRLVTESQRRGQRPPVIRIPPR